MNDVKKLEAELNNAIEQFKLNAKDTTLLCENAELQKALKNVYEDIGRCLSDFESAIIEHLKS